MGSRSLRFPSFSNFAKDFSCSFISSSSASAAVFISSRFFGCTSLSVVLPRFKTSPTPVLLDLFDLLFWLGWISLFRRGGFRYTLGFCSCFLTSRFAGGRSGCFCHYIRSLPLNIRTPSKNRRLGTAVWGRRDGTRTRSSSWCSRTSWTINYLWRFLHLSKFLQGSLFWLRDFQLWVSGIIQS